MIGRRRCGLDEEHVLPAHVFLDFYKRLAVRERRDGDFAQFDADGFADGAGQWLVRRAGKYFHR